MKAPPEWTRTRDVLVKLSELGFDFFTPDDLVDRLGMSRQAAHDVARRLVAGGQVRRLKRGLYAVVQPAFWNHPQEGFPGNWYLAAARLAAPADYYLTYYTAMELHEMLQHPLSTVVAATTHQRPSVKVGPVTFRFIRISAKKFFGYESRQVERGKSVQVADLEKTFVDAVDRMDLCGGLEEVVRGFGRRHHALNADRLIRHAVLLDSPTIMKRLGFILEAVGYEDTSALLYLRRAAGRLHHYVPLDPKRPAQKAERDTRWEIIVNVPLERLLGARDS